MKKAILAATMLFTSMAVAEAATFTVKTYTDSDRTYIAMSGATEEGDYDRYVSAYNQAKAGWRFSGAIYFFDAPGGHAYEGVRIAEHIRKNKLDTYVNNSYCISACSLMWMAGNYRHVRGEKGGIGFHFAYTRDTEFLENLKDLNGWIGIQDHVSQSSHWYTAQLFKYSVAKPFEFLTMLSSSGANDIVWVHKDNMDLVGNGRSVFRPKPKPRPAITNNKNPKVHLTTTNGRQNLFITNLNQLANKRVEVTVFDENGRVMGIRKWNTKHDVDTRLFITIAHNGLLDLQVLGGKKPYRIVIKHSLNTYTYYV